MWLDWSAYQIVVVIQIVAHTVSGVSETSWSEHGAATIGRLWDASLVLHVSNFLHLCDSSWWAVLFSPVKWIIFLGHLETTDWYKEKHSNEYKDAKELHDLGTLLLEMHGSAWIWQFKVKIFIYETSCMRKVMSEIISIHIVIMDEHSSVLILGLEVESHIVPMSWPNLIVIMHCMSHIWWQW